MLLANSASAVVVTIDNSVGFPIGAQLSVHRRGAGTVTIAATNGAVLRSPYGRTSLSAQYSTAGIVKATATDWVLSGDLT